MNNLIYMPIYLNEKLLLSIYPIVIDGYIESKSIKSTKDKSNSLKISKDCKHQHSNDHKVSNNNKDHNKTKDLSETTTDDSSGTLDDKHANKNELTIKKIYTKFYLFHDLRNTMINTNMLRHITELDIINNNIQSGEYVEFDSKITSESTCNGIINLINIIHEYDSKELDKLLKNTETQNSLTNYTIIERQLENFKKLLEMNDSDNIVMQFNKCKAVLNIDKKCFYSRNIYDNSNFSCKVLCKVLRCINNNDSICLLDKTGMQDYYKDYIKSLDPYLDILKENNIVIPENIITEITGPAIQVIPMGIYV
ncbi:hypothetical protein OW763_01200 [Clostridium aestuarii]|uniref:Uncharacterized protein n=1 Tax=Clostridium aestuarii TaxID=338193 RepID=A0ABT4CVF5_9CLOT|nr:hypothetical protein [Clostridium aestuarii]MCY6482972.1 hypothetical protein [Clostridium aestuarii]